MSYKLKYSLKTISGEFSRGEALYWAEQFTDNGATDALIITSVLYPEDGSLSMKTFSIDGRNEGKDLEDIELFKLWILLAGTLQESKTLPASKKQLLNTTFLQFSESIKKGWL
jgi:hypothetical protein